MLVMTCGFHGNNWSFIEIRIMASNGAATRGEGKRLRSRDMVDCLQWKPGSYYVVVGSSRPSHEHRIESCQFVVQHSSKVHLCSALILTSLHHHL